MTHEHIARTTATTKTRAVTARGDLARRTGAAYALAGAAIAGALFAGTVASDALIAPARADCASFPGTTPADDSDGDCLPTWAENVYKSNPNNPDTDGDGFNDGVEVGGYHTDPTKSDTDGDGDSDSTEVFLQKDPLDPKSHSDIVKKPPAPNRPAPAAPASLDPRGDADGDGLFNEDETDVYQTNPRKADTDGDGADDGQEVFDDIDPLRRDR